VGVSATSRSARVGGLKQFPVVFSSQTLKSHPRRMPISLPNIDEPLRIRWVLALAVAYAIAGKLGLMLAIPPGYATAVWPPSGIALGLLLLWGPRYWPGVLLGSMLVNLLSSYDGSTGWTLFRSFAIATSIGGGAALQAAMGAMLLRRYLDSSLTLTRERDVLIFFVIGGPLAHAINATWGVSTLLIAGAIPAAALAQNWWTWWAGDTIGALVFAPLVIMWLGDEAAWATRRALVTVPLAITFAAAIAVFVYTSRAEWDQLRQRFAEDTADLANAIAKHVDLNIETLHSVGALFAADPHIDRAAFERFADPVVARRVELQALAWAPHIDHAQRATFERELNAALPTAIGISEVGDNGRLHARPRESYFPVQFVAPSRDNPLLVGLDIASEQRRRDALSAALASTQVAATTPITLVQTSNPGILLVLPIFDSSTSPALQGYAAAALAIDKLLAGSLRDKSLATDVTIDIDDVTSQPSQPAYASKRMDDLAADAALPAAMRFSNEIQIRIADRAWRMRFTPTLAYLVARQPQTAWLILAGGMLFTSLIGAGALLVTGRARAVETLVRSRTTELAEINEKLADEICDHLSTEHTLAAERELLRTVLNNLHEGILVLDSRGELQMANGVAYRMLRSITGLELSKIPRPRPFKLYAADGVTELPYPQTPHWRALRGQTVTDLELVAQSPGRPAMSLIVNAHPLFSGEGRRNGAIIAMRDVTDTKVVERLKAEFVATVSHELRTPITSIRGSLGLISGGVAGPLSEKVRSLVDIALRNSDRLAHLINDLLDIEKMESGKMQFEFQRQPLAALIEQAVEANQGYAQSHNVRFALRRPAPEAMVRVDSFRLLQVMSNLLSNAAKFSPRGSTVDIAIDALNESQVRVLVTDRGPGIPEDFRARMFQKFSQADSADNRAKSGTGLGLAICKSIVEQMGGSIGYETEAGKGTTFYFDLPLMSNERLAATA
jgi:signal transduction histidine kinase/integral membrane sensor domain MASE1